MRQFICGVFLLGIVVFPRFLPGADESADVAEFNKLDLNEDGVLSGKEMRPIAAYDTNSDGDVTRAEFLAGRRRDRLPGAKPADPKALFASKDLNEDGVLSGKESRGLESYDSNRDGDITLAEFVAGWKKDEAKKPVAPTAKADPVAADPGSLPPDAVPMDTATKAWTKQLTAQLEQGDRWAVVIGVNKYAKSPLRFCVPDAQLVSETLVKHCGYPRDHVLLMTDDSDNRHLQPRKNQLQEQIPAFLSKAEKNDTVLVFFAGHGLTKDGQSFLCPLDFDGDSTKTTGWRVDELRTILQDCNAGQKLLILDCCHSGGAVTTSGFGASPQKIGGAFETAQGLITFASCRTNQTSLESAESGHGVFTHTLAAGLAGEADTDRNRIIDSDELYRHLLVQVPIAARLVTRGHKQFPVRIIGQDVVGVFALARPDGKTIDEKKRYKTGDLMVNSIGMRLTILPRGVAALGSPNNEYLRDEDEQLCPIIMSRSNVMGIHEVTQAQYARVMGTNPSWFSTNGGGATDVAGLKTDDFPVEQVSYEDAVRFCNKLSKLPDEMKAGRQYRLPTEAEREFACRAGTYTPFHTGEQISSRQANIRGDRPYLDSPKGLSLGRTTSVGAYPPNAYGLYDMHGNVGEWCLDHLDRGLVSVNSRYNFSKTAKGIEGLIEEFAAAESSDKPMYFPSDPVGEIRTGPRAYRGGAYSGDVGFCRSASRREQNEDYAHRTIGFRVVCELTN